jgi:amino acid transporter
VEAFQEMKEATLVQNTGKPQQGNRRLRTRLTTCYRHNPYSAFRNGFHGFCGVFVTAAFAYTGTELVGLAAAETKNPEKEIPRASKQVALRIFIFYIVNLFLIGLIVPVEDDTYSGDGPTSRYSPFVIAIQLAGIKVLPSIFNAVILIAVMSVANSCTFGSTRTIQALAANGMYPAGMTPWKTSG